MAAKRLLLFPVVIAVLLPGCIAPINGQWDVTRFHDLDAIKGKTYALFPLREELLDSPEFRAYAEMAEKKLNTYGLVSRSFNKLGTTDYLVGLDYGFGEPQVITMGGRTRGTLVNGGNGLNFLDGDLFSAEQIPIATKHRCHVRLFLFNGKMSGGKLVKRFEAKAECSSASDDLPGIVASGLKALLAEFPGTSGSPKRENVVGSRPKP